ncbi:protein FAR1-RELATED SEQUENCE 5-like [Primulina eburnea]|uniref:protein FAR1-RELATED SEQUENCE 5-like n=1 Tax=Primulina eburnea TaxID=1245227 RepID=UPI003C6CB349
MKENSGDELSYIPQVGYNQKPEIGMKLESLEEAFSFYNQCTRESGFSARMSNSKKSNKTKKVIWKKFVCFKEGYTDANRWSKQSKSDEPVKERARVEIRTRCKSKISVVKEQTGLGWIVSTFMESHNHPLSTPSKIDRQSECVIQRLEVLYSFSAGSKKALSQKFAEANVPSCQQMRLFEIESGGPEHVGCTERYIRNYEKTLRDEHKGIDAETLIDFFLSEKDKSSTFFFDYDTNSDNRFIRCFWTDPISKRAYTTFGDVVVFDTTYNTNKYWMIFAPFVGVNHHQTIVFACGFLSDEKTDSFVWLLNKFLEAMPKEAPHLIITDQDPDMTKAIGMSSSQRSESSHAFFKRYVFSKNSLMDFIIRFNKALRHQRHNELVSDHTDMNERPKVKSNWPMELKMVNVYTKNKWLEFQNEISLSHGYYVQQASIGIEFGVYNVINFQEIRTKGRVKRLKSSKENSTSRARQCRGCGHRGVSHDKRNCPNLKDGSTVNNDNTDENSDEEDFGSIDVDDEVRESDEASPDDGSNPLKDIMDWVFNNTRAKIMELINKNEQ